MLKYGVHFLCCLLLLVCFQQAFVSPVVAGEKEERVQLLQQKMEKLQQLLEAMKEEKLREQPPTEIPWQAILKADEERPAYDQYAYLLAPQMRAGDLDSILQQLHYLATQDQLKERGALFVIPALPLAVGEKMSVKSYNRDLAGSYIKKIGLPTALEGGMIISPNPLGEGDVAKEPLLFIDLTGCDHILRARIFGLLQSQRLFTADGSIHSYLWELMKSASPQEFTVYMQDNLTWLALAD